MKKRLILSIILVLLIVACGTKVSEIKDSLAKPLSPIGLKVDSSTDTSVTLSWSAANTATSLLTTGYTIESATSEDFTKNSNKTTETNTTATVKDLTKGLTYYFRVVANNSKADLSSAPSNVVSQVVGKSTDGGTSNTSSSKPMLSDITIEKNSDGKIVISWKVTPGKDDDGRPEAITKFLVRTATTEEGLSLATATEVDANVLTSTIETSPVVGTTYWVDVQAVTANSNVAFAKSDVVVKSYTELIYPNAYKFTHSGHTYYIVNTHTTWVNAASDAVSNGGYLVHIDNQAEQNAIETAITASGFTFDQEAVGSSRYIWIGATDATTEGTWVWNGDNTGATEPLGTGRVQGQFTADMKFIIVNSWSTATGAYQNWGQGSNYNQNRNDPPQNEPGGDLSNEDYGAMALENWPVNISDGVGLGTTYQWNDIEGINTMPYIVEVE